MKLITLRPLPEQVFVACSGGLDSVSVVVRACELKRKVTLAFFHHRDEFSDMEEEFVRNLSRDFGLDIITSQAPTKALKSKEKTWRDFRQPWFQSLPGTVLTGHNLDDAVEWYIMTCLQGQGYFMNYENGNVKKPFLLTKKVALRDYLVSRKVSWLEDPSNYEVEFTPRNRVRHNILPEALKINPGLYKVVEKGILKKEGRYVHQIPGL